MIDVQASDDGVSPRCAIGKKTRGPFPLARIR